MDRDHLQQTATLSVIGVNGTQVVLLVVPPHTDPDRAYSALTAAAAPGEAPTVADLLAISSPNELTARHLQPSPAAGGSERRTALEIRRRSVTANSGAAQRSTAHRGSVGASTARSGDGAIACPRRPRTTQHQAALVRWRDSETAAGASQVEGLSGSIEAGANGR